MGGENEEEQPAASPAHSAYGDELSEENFIEDERRGASRARAGAQAAFVTAENLEMAEEIFGAESEEERPPGEEVAAAEESLDAEGVRRSKEEEQILGTDIPERLQTRLKGRMQCS